MVLGVGRQDHWPILGRPHFIIFLVRMLQNATKVNILRARVNDWYGTQGDDLFLSEGEYLLGRG